MKIIVGNNSFVIIIDRNILIECSGFFASMFGCGVVDEDYEIDLTIVVGCSVEYVRMFFDLAFDLEMKWKPYIKTKYVSDSRSDKYEYELKIRFGLPVPLADYGYFIVLGDYFLMDQFNKFVKESIRRYSDAIVWNKFSLCCIDEVLRVPKNNTHYFNNMVVLRRVWLMRYTVENVIAIYSIYQDGFQKILSEIKNMSNFGIDLFGIDYKCCFSGLLKKLPLKELCYPDKLISNDEKFILYDYYDILKSDGRIVSLKNKDMALKIFNDLVGILFSSFDWNGVVMFGAFLFDIIGMNRVIRNTSIELYIEEKENIRRVVDYFGKTGAYVLEYEQHLIIVSTQIEFGIKIYFNKSQSDFGIWYNGQEFTCNIDLMFLLKYGACCGKLHHQLRRRGIDEFVKQKIFKLEIDTNSDSDNYDHKDMIKIITECNFSKLLQLYGYCTRVIYPVTANIDYLGYLRNVTETDLGDDFIVFIIECLIGYKQNSTVELILDDDSDIMFIKMIGSRKIPKISFESSRLTNIPKIHRDRVKQYIGVEKAESYNSIKVHIINSELTELEQYLSYGIFKVFMRDHSNYFGLILN